MATNTNPVLGAVIIARHGDRQGFYQSPTTYTATATAITAVGEVEEYQLGDLMRRTYAVSSSADYITGLNETALTSSQINSTADGGGEGGVIFDSATAFWQGFYPPTTGAISTITLANGTNITSPLNGYQYIQINAVLPTDDVDLEGWTNCNAWTARTNAVYNSTAFLAVQSEHEAFLTGLATSGLVGGRAVTLSNMWNIFDFMNVQSIHNATYAADLRAYGNSTLAMVRTLANYHEYVTFTDSTGAGIGNVAGKTFLSRVIPSLQAFTSTTNTVKIAHYQTAYKPFLSVFNMTNVAGSGTFPYPDAIVDYASVMTFEVRENMAGNGHDVRFNFRNGTTDGDSNGLVPYPLFNSGSVDMDLNTFVSNLEPYIFADNKAWCTGCNSTGGICSLYTTINSLNASIATLNSTGGSGGHHDAVSPIGAGFIGFAVTTAVFLAALAVLGALGIVSFGAAAGSRRRRNQSGIPLKAGSMNSGHSGVGLKQ